jgi:hypothetical protein
VKALDPVADGEGSLVHQGVHDIILCSNHVLGLIVPGRGVGT